MRSTLWTFSLLLFSISAFAKTEIPVHPIKPYKTHGSIIVDTENGIFVEYRLEGVTPNKSYAVFIYAKGNCTSYSDLVVPQILDAAGKILKLNEPEDYLIAAGSSPVTANYGGQAHLPEFIFYQMDFKGKLLVLKELEKNKSIGAAVACGIRP